MTMLASIFRGVIRIDRGTLKDVLVVGLTYERSFFTSVSSSISLKVEATDMDFPLFV